jgi:23S rRNA (guanine745-N1)-methyltransferase
MLTDVLAALACPQCGGSLALDDRALRCDAGHSFDVARQGYVNLLPGRANSSTADTPAMIAARRVFLDGGHFAPITHAVISAVGAAVPEDASGVYLDAGAGTGYALSALLDAAPTRAGIALDISKHAAKVAASAHERIGSIVADVWTRLPLRDGCAALVLDIFSPRNAEEFARVLVDGGMLVVVTPNPEHLAELVGPLGLITVDPRKSERLSTKLGSHFEQVAEQVVTYPLELSRADAIAAAAMGPSAAHVSADELTRRVESLDDPIMVTVSVTVGTYRAHPLMAAQT